MLRPKTQQVVKNKVVIGSIAETSLPNFSNPSEIKNSRSNKADSVNYIALDRFRREVAQKQEEVNQQWKAKYDPWLIDEYRAMHTNIGKVRGKPPNELTVPLARPEWQQPTDILPPIYKRLPGQRRRRLLGAFPQTESDKIGWRLLPEHAIDKFGTNISNIPPLPKKYKMSSWPVEMYH